MERIGSSGQTEPDGRIEEIIGRTANKYHDGNENRRQRGLCLCVRPFAFVASALLMDVLQSSLQGRAPASIIIKCDTVITKLATRALPHYSTRGSRIWRPCNLNWRHFWEGGEKE